MSDLKMPITPELREYFAKIGRIRGNQLKEKYGSEYFRKLAAMRKTHGRQSKTGNGTYQDLAEKYSVSKQRIQQLIKKHGHKFDVNNFIDIYTWREAVIKDYFENRDNNK